MEQMMNETDGEQRMDKLMLARDVMMLIKKYSDKWQPGQFALTIELSDCDMSMSLGGKCSTGPRWLCKIEDDSDEEVDDIE